MSLKVWLPLNGNLNNQGCSPLKPIQMSVTPTYVNGKIGQALSTGDFYLPGAEVAKFYNNNGMSWAFWIYPTTSGSVATPIIGQSNTGAGACRMFTIFQYPNGTDLHLSWQNETGGDAFLASILTNAFVVNTWNHCAITYNGSTVTVYINGTVRETYTNHISARTNFNYDVPIPNASCRYLNDLRIYDHCLSPKEVKEISKALVVHYPLDGNGKGGDNLLYNTNTANTNLFGYSEQVGGSNKTIEYDGGIPCIKVTRNSTAHSGWAFMWHNNLNHSAIKTSTTYTVSFDAIASGSSGIGFSGFVNSNATNSLSESVEIIQSGFNATNWSHIIFRTTTKSSFDGLEVGNQVVYMNCGFMNSTGVWIKVKNFKVEEGTVDTPWCPNSSDALYTTLGYNSITEYDTSGFGNNGTKSGTITQVSDTPRYDTGFYFLAGSGVFSHPNINLSQFTISFWGKHTATGKMLMGSNASTSSTNSIWYWYGDNSFKYPSGEYYYLHNAGSAESLLNKWTHFVAVYNGSTISVYRNGVYEGNQAVSGDMLLEYLSVGNGYLYSNYWENGYVSDFRLYATALSADDVKELYQTSAQLDNKGNIYAYDFEEV